MTLRAAGNPNTLCWFDGETSIPATFADDMRRLGVQIIYAYPDRDTTGMKMAAKLQDVLRDTGIQVALRQLPGELGSKNDLNWLWQHVKFDTNAFQEALMDAPPINDDDLELYRAETVLPDIRTEPTSSGELPTAFIQAIESALGVTKFDKDGWSKNRPCIFQNHEHDKENPAFSWNRNSQSSKCFKCGQNWNAKETAAQLGIALSDFLVQPAAPSKPLPPKQSAPAPATDDLFTDSTTASQNVINLLRGEGRSLGQPMPFPFTTLHEFGGFAEIMWPGKLVYINGVSGGGKTSFGESLYEIMMKTGDDSIWFGPEWTAEEMRLRALQRAGGESVASIGKLLAWLEDGKRGVPPADRSGRPLAAGKLDEQIRILEGMTRWPGQAFYMNSHKSLNTMAAICEAIERLVIAKRAEGRNMRALFFDYLQRAPKDGKGSWDQPEIIAGQIKDLCERLQLFGFVFIQPTKGDSKAARDGNDLTEASGQGISDQQANLYITMTPEFESGVKKPYIKMQVVKNSLGKTGKLYLKWAAQNLCIVDEKADVYDD